MINHNGRYLVKPEPTIFSVFDEFQGQIIIDGGRALDDRYFVRSKESDEILFVLRVGKSKLPYFSFRQLGVTDRTVTADDCALQLNEDISVYNDREIELIKSLIKYALVK